MAVPKNKGKYLYVGMAPLSLKKSNGLELPNADVFFKPFHTHALRVLLYTIILSKNIKYTSTVIVRKLKKCRLFIIRGSRTHGRPLLIKDTD